MSKIDELKFAVFNEWSYDPPSPFSTLYYDAKGTTYKEIMWPVTEVYDHLSWGVYDEEADELKDAYKSVKPTKKSIENFEWENGGLGCGCEFIVEGKEIAEKAAEFYHSVLADFYEDYDDEVHTECEKIITEAVNNPENYTVVIKLLDLISEAVEKRNSRY